MVSKGRLAGFIDAIIAVIMTIMLLEFELPKTGGILDFLKDNLVYLIAYLLSFIYVTTSWFINNICFHRLRKSLVESIIVA
ncbi:TMEM175 family protein [Lactococcus lactis]|uniref:TMEM175 family protein n=1 Tax=Lactococcus lactis TaxID=1358 RepID=UPI001D18BE67|nr:TMEM175 family protein [Lactococcus lactis]MCC4119766.1 TMEM175 family protein [Lactococcus lactis]